MNYWVEHEGHNWHFDWAYGDEMVVRRYRIQADRTQNYEGEETIRFEERSPGEIWLAGVRIMGDTLDEEEASFKRGVRVWLEGRAVAEAAEAAEWN